MPVRHLVPGAPMANQQIGSQGCVLSSVSDGGAQWLVIILENSEGSELSLPLPLALFSFSPLRGLLLICSLLFPPTHTDRAGGLQTASVWSQQAGEPACRPGCWRGNWAALKGWTARIAASALVTVWGFSFSFCFIPNAVFKGFALCALRVRCFKIYYGA